MMDFITTLQALLIVFKLANLITINWWFVMTPALSIIVCGICYGIGCVVVEKANRKDD